MFKTKWFDYYYYPKESWCMSHLTINKSPPRNINCPGQSLVSIGDDSSILLSTGLFLYTLDVSLFCFIYCNQLFVHRVDWL